MTDTIRQLIDNSATDGSVLGAPGRPAKTYGHLAVLADTTVRDLNARSIGRGNRVAIVLPNGPEMATAFLAISSGGTTAPLNPTCREEELEFTPANLNAKAQVVEAYSASPARLTAPKRGLAVLEITTVAGAAAGNFWFAADAVSAQNGEPAGPDDFALEVHASRTASWPKIVLLSQTNMAASTQYIRSIFFLTINSIYLNIMPLFRIHGLIAAVLSSVAAGAGIFCSPDFNALRFFTRITEADPRWYTAVPTMHQTILSRAVRHAGTIESGRHRFDRSTSPSLAPQVIAELEDTFGCPVIEAWGMTEATHQIARNPLSGGRFRTSDQGVIDIGGNCP